MILLNEKNLLSLTRKLAADSLEPPVPPLIVEYRHSIVVTDGGLLLEWPKARVDPRCALYQHMVEAGTSHRKAVELREVECWLDFLIRGQLQPAEEADPQDDDHMKGCLVYRYLDQRCFFSAAYIEVVEWVMEGPPTFKCLQPEGFDKKLVLLCPMSGKVPAGAVANWTRKD